MEISPTTLSSADLEVGETDCPQNRPDGNASLNAIALSYLPSVFRFTEPAIPVKVEKLVVVHEVRVVHLHIWTGRGVQNHGVD